MDLEVVRFRPDSLSERAALTALLDLGELLAELPIDVDQTRVIGGHMVTLHVTRAKLGKQFVRLTKDIDFGLEKLHLRRLDLVERFAARGYNLTRGHRFVRPLGFAHGGDAIVDVLIPRYTSGPGKKKKIAGMNIYQTPALATLLRREPLMLEVQVDLGDGEVRSTSIATADERGALYSKVAAWDDRRKTTEADKDAFDIWRCLEVCRLAGVHPGSWPTDFDDLDWRRVLNSDFGTRAGPGSLALGQQLRAHALDADAGVTRTIALIKSVVG